MDISEQIKPICYIYSLGSRTLIKWYIIIQIEEFNQLGLQPVFKSDLQSRYIESGTFLLTGPYNKCILARLLVVMILPIGLNFTSLETLLT